jgi:hypothetical protein
MIHTAVAGLDTKHEDHICFSIIEADLMINFEFQFVIVLRLQTH